MINFNNMVILLKYIPDTMMVNDSLKGLSSFHTFNAQPNVNIFTCEKSRSPFPNKNLNYMIYFKSFEMIHTIYGYKIK